MRNGGWEQFLTSRLEYGGCSGLSLLRKGELLVELQGDGWNDIDIQQK